VITVKAAIGVVAGKREHAAQRRPGRNDLPVRLKSQPVDEAGFAGKARGDFAAVSERRIERPVDVVPGKREVEHRPSVKPARAENRALRLLNRLVT
jgi:hypothetical protein